MASKARQNWLSSEGIGDRMPGSLVDAGVQRCPMRKAFEDRERFREGWRTALFVLLFFLVLFAAGFLTATAQT